MLNPRGSKSAIPCLSLASYRQQENGVDLRKVSIQRDITVCPSSDYQFPQVVSHWASNQWIVLENRYGMNDLIDPDRRFRNIELV